MKFVGKVVKILLEFIIGCAIFLVVSVLFIFFGTWLAIFLDNYASKIENWVFLFLGIGAVIACWHMGHDNGVRIEVEDEEGNFSAVNLSKHSTLELVKCLINLANGQR